MGWRVVGHGSVFTVIHRVRLCDRSAGHCAEGVRSRVTFERGRFRLRELCCTWSPQSVGAVGHHLLSLILNGWLSRYLKVPQKCQLKQGYRSA